MNVPDSSDVSLRIRVGMDVYNSFGDRYLGSVVKVWRGPERTVHGSHSAEHQSSVTGSPQVHEEGNVVDHASAQGEPRNGEEMGPFPTAGAGNTGPSAQSAAHQYACAETDDRTDVVRFAVRPGRINLGVFSRSFHVPTSAVTSVSMERILLTTSTGLPTEWRQKLRD